MLRIPPIRAGWPALVLATLAAAGAPCAQAVFIADDFEDKLASNKLSQSSEWAFLSDADSHGNSLILSGDTAVNPSLIDSNSFAAPGYGGSQACFKLEWKYGSQRPHGDAPDTSSYDPEVGMITQIWDESLNVGADFTGASKVSFWAKAAKTTRLRIAAVTPEVADYAYWGDELTIGTAWKQYSLDFSAKTFAQPEWKSKAVPFNKKKISAFMIVISRAYNPGAGGTFWMDDFSVTGWKPKEVEPPVGIARNPAAHRPASLEVSRGSRVDGRRVLSGTGSPRFAAPR